MELGPLIIGFTFCWITWVIFSTLRRYLLGRSQAALQEKVFSHIDSVESMLALAANDSGRKFLESLTLERSEPFTPHTRILYGVQAGIVLASFGFAMLYLHHVQLTHDLEFLVFGAGAVGLGIGFLIASATSL